MKLKNVILGTLICWMLATLTGTHARAGRQFLVNVGSEMKKGWTPISVAYDDATFNLIGLYVDNDFYSAKEIQKGTKIRIDGIDNSRDVIKLQGPALNEASGGAVKLIYLHDGRNDIYRSVSLAIKRPNPKYWSMHLPNDDRAISSFYLTENTFLGFTVGVKEVKISFSKASPKPQVVALAVD